MKTKNPRTQNFCKNSIKPCQINYKKQKGTISWLHPSKKGMEWFTVNRVLKVQGQMRIPVIIQPSPQPDTNITKNILYYIILLCSPINPHTCTRLRYLSKWNFAFSPRFFLSATMIFSALSWHFFVMRVKAGLYMSLNFCFDHQVYNIG